MIEFKTIEELKQSSDYLSGDWFRIVRNNVTNTFTLEMRDYGTPLTHQTTVEVNRKKILEIYG